MFEAHMPVRFWPEAIATATYLTNRLPTKTLYFQTPLTTLNTFTTIPFFHSLSPRIFWCVVYVHLPSRVRTKFEPRAVKCVFLGYDITQKGYRCYDPLGFSDEYKQGEGCKLKKALYGLKQSPRAWFGRFTTTIKRFGHRQSNSDHNLFLRKNGNQITCLVIYVDDMVITGNNAQKIDKLKSQLFQEFEMKDLGQLKYFLGIEVLRSKRGYLSIKGSKS